MKLQVSLILTIVWFCVHCTMQRNSQILHYFNIFENENQYVWFGVDQHELGIKCDTCSKEYSSVVEYYSEDMCGDNAIPKNVKMYVNNTIAR